MPMPHYLFSGIPTFCHLHMIFKYHIARITPSAAVYGRAGCVPFHCQLGCAVFATFFIRFKANLGEYGSYSLHICMLRYIRKHHFFASFASYSLQNIHTDLHTNIGLDAEKYMLQQIFPSERIFA
jgi:hypothetical protein